MMRAGGIRQCGGISLCVLIGCGWTATLRAHPAFLTSAEITVEADGKFHGRAEFDLLAFVLNDASSRIGNEPMEQLLAGPKDTLASQLEEAKGRFLRGLAVTTDGGPGTVDTVTFPTADEVIRWRDTQRPVLPVVIPVVMTGHLPPAAHQLAVRFPSVLEQVILDVERPGEEPFLQPVEAGHTSVPLPVQIRLAPESTRGVQADPGRSAPTATRRSRAGGNLAIWLTGGHFLLLLGGLVLVSFGGAVGWSRLSARP